MLDKELRQKQQPLRDDLARAADPEYDEKVQVHRLAKELNRSIRWVIHKSGGDMEGMHASYRLTKAEQSSVREEHRQGLAAPERHPDSLVMTLSKLARELMLPRIDVIHEVIRRGVARENATPKLMLYASEVEALLEFFGQRWKWRHDNPLPYAPSADGRISFEIYERIRQDEREGLEMNGLLPSRLELSRHPKRAWPEIKDHFGQLRGRDASPGPNLNQHTSAPSPQRPSPEPATSILPQKGPAAAVSLTRDRPKSTSIALIPPKPPSVAQLQTRKVGLLKKEVEGGEHTGLSHEPAFRTYRNDLSVGSAAVSDLQETLREFHPRMYASFFDQFRAVLELDRKVARTISSNLRHETTDGEHMRIINEICAYSYGIFAYWEMGSKIGRRSRSLPLPSSKKVKNALVKLRPMYMGVLTDLCHTRFIFWRVGPVWDLLEVRFDDLHDWLDGLAAGEYVPLTTHHVPLGNYQKVAMVESLSNRDQDIVKFMSEAAQNLRQGVHGVRGRKAVTGASGSVPRAAGIPRSSGPRTLGYRPENTWLVPITINNGHVDATLDEDFFIGSDDKKPHQIRPFYRRPKGSAPGAPRTEFVSGHVRGGRGAFADMKLLPVVTIRRR